MDVISGNIRPDGAAISGGLSEDGACSGNVTVMQLPPYNGPYEVTPSEDEQGLETEGCEMLGNIVVDGIPADYVGSEIARRDADDVNIVTLQLDKVVSVPDGYYDGIVLKTLPNGSATTPQTSMTATPTFQINNGQGKVSASFSVSQNITPTVSEGYITSGTAGNVQASGSGEYQLPTQAGQTVTPTEQEQMVVVANKWTTGDVKVAAIPSDHVGSDVPRQAATEYTPSNSVQVIPSGKYLTGDQTIKAVAPPFYDMSVANAWMGAGAELVQTFTLADVKLSATSFASWTPSTTATDILATRTAGSFTATDMENYDYFLCWDTKIPIVYQEGAVDKARGLFLSAFHVQALCRRASSYANYKAQNQNSNVCVTAFSGGNFYRYYGSTQGTITYTNSASYGFYGTVTAATFSSSTAASPTVTVKTPKVTARCSTTYLSTGNAALIDQAKTIISQKCRVYRVKKPAFMQGCWDNIMRLVNEIDP